jgi:hypothetical protein
MKIPCVNNGKYRIQILTPMRYFLFSQLIQSLHETQLMQLIQFSQLTQYMQSIQFLQLIQSMLSSDFVFIFFGLFIIVLLNISSLPPNSSTNLLDNIFIG